MGDADLENLKSRLASLGVNVKLDGASPAVPTTSGQPQASNAARQRVKMDVSPLAAGKGARHIDQDGKQGVTDLLNKLNKVEVAINAAETLSHVAQQRVAEQIAKDSAPGNASPTLKPAKGKRKVLARPKQVQLAGVTIPKVVSTAPVNANKLHDTTKGVPHHTPLASVLAQYKEAEVTWANEKAKFRREAFEQRKRANQAELELKRLQRLVEFKSLDIKALKSALKNRDNQLVASSERVKELEEALGRVQEEGAQRIAALNAERDDLKALLLATLQRLEAVDDVVHRADVSSAIMQEKVKSLEEERLRALEAAARARAEVQELAESKRKLQWQSKLLEKMSEVQLKHNKRKSEAIKKLLSDPSPMPDNASESDMGLEDSSLLLGDPVLAAGLRARGY